MQRLPSREPHSAIARRWRQAADENRPENCPAGPLCAHIHTCVSPCIPMSVDMSLCTYGHVHARAQATWKNKCRPRHAAADGVGRCHLRLPLLLAVRRAAFKAARQPAAGQNQVSLSNHPGLFPRIAWLASAC